MVDSQVPGRVEAPGTMTIEGLLELGRPVHLRVDAITLDNFKSFKQRTRVPLREGFSTVSGPNGSGKSNVIDAMLFVMGLASAKGMRAERLTDLICSDGQRNWARVALELTGTFNSEGLDGGGGLVERRFEVGRVVRRLRSGTSAHYELDGEPVRLGDLHEVLQVLGFPTSGQNIVLQGDVIRLTSMGPVARRHVLDELAGVKEFDRRIGQADEELQGAQRVTEDTRLVLKELDERLGQLRKERDQALKYRELVARRGELGGSLLVLDVVEAELRVRAKEGEIAAAEETKGRLERSLEVGRAGVAACEGEVGELEEELRSKGEGERLKAVREVEGLRARAVGARERATGAAGEAKALRAEMPVRRQRGAEARGRLERLGVRVAEVEGVLGEREKAHRELVGTYQQASDALRAQSAAQIEAAQRGHQLRLVAEAQRVREAGLVERDRELAEGVSRREEELKHVAGSVEGQSSRRTELVGRQAEVTERYRARRDEWQAKQSEQRQLHQRLQDLRSGLEGVERQVSRAEQELAGAEARRLQALTLGGGKALSVLQEHDLPGIHGTVADLVSFEARYAAALEAAGGGRLNWVVVDDEHVAKRAIELLKRERAGRLSFAPLTKIRGPKLEGPLPRGGAVVGYALDLVEAERVYDEVLASVFGSTVVMERLQDALPLIGRYRMVTLDGDVLEPRGLMTGGSAGRGSRALLAAAAATEEIDRVRERLGELDKKRSAARGALREAEAAWHALGGDLARLQAEVKESEEQVAGLGRELERLDGELGPSRGTVERVTSELERLRGERGRVGEELVVVRGELRGVLDQLEGLDEPQDSDAFEALTREARAYEATMRQSEEGLARLRAERAELEAERRGALEQLQQLEGFLKEAEERVEALEERAEEAEEEAERLTETLKAREEALEALSAELMELTRRRDGARERLRLARERLGAVEVEASALATRLEGLVEECGGLRRGVAGLRARAVEEEVVVPVLEEVEEVVRGLPEGDVPKERQRLQGALGKVEAELGRMGPVNQLAVEQYEECEGRREELGGKIGSLEEEQEQIRARMVDLEGKKRRAFLEAFELVSSAFAETFQELARGQGKLQLEDPKDPFGGGLIIKAQPRGKKLSRLEVMSGGEKSLTALAFIFALQEVNPAPFFVFDEVDAALDGVNTEILAEAIRRRSEERQYLVISHRRVMLEKSQQTLGVTMRRGLGTQVTGVAIEEPEEGARDRERAAEELHVQVAGEGGE